MSDSRSHYYVSLIAAQLDRLLQEGDSDKADAASKRPEIVRLSRAKHCQLRAVLIRTSRSDHSLDAVRIFAKTAEGAIGLLELEQALTALQASRVLGSRLAE